jgi:glycerol kinase
LEGSVFVGGSVIQWLRDKMEFFKNSSDCEKYIQHKDPSNGVYLVPAFVGLGTPYWDNDARGSIFGLTRSSSKENIIAAALESIAFQVKDVMDVMEKESNSPIKYLGVDGGASVNNYLMQFQADILDVKLMRSKCKETTAIGAMYLAALAVGMFEKIEDIKKLHQVDKIFFKNMNDELRNKKLIGWKKAVKATLEFK